MLVSSTVNPRYASMLKMSPGFRQHDTVAQTVGRGLGLSEGEGLEKKPEFDHWLGNWNGINPVVLRSA